MGAEVAPAAAGTSADSRSSAQSAYKLTGPLPSGQPDDAPVYALDGPYSTERLARVLDRAGLSKDHASWWWSQAQTCAVPPAGAPESKPGTEPAPLPPDTPVSSDGTATPSDKDAPCASSGAGSSSSSGTVTAVAPPSPDDSVKGDPQGSEPALGEPRCRRSQNPPPSRPPRP